MTLRMTRGSYLSSCPERIRSTLAWWLGVMRFGNHPGRRRRPLGQLGHQRSPGRWGYDVIAVASADEAIKVLETRNDIRTIFTDIDLPGSMGGLKLAAAVRDR